MKLVLAMNYTDSMIATGVIISTAPLLGVYIGGYLADRIKGGTKNIKHTFRLSFSLLIVGYFFNDILTFI